MVEGSGGASVTSIEAEQRRAGKAPSPWTPAVVDLLRDWAARASASAETHFATAADLGRRNVLLGVPVVVLTTFVGTSVFATLEQTVGIELRIVVGLVSVLAAVLASLQTFLRFAERAERHRAAGERWAAINREIAEMVALHPTYLASRGDPKQYLDELRRRMDEIAAESPPMPSRAWVRTLDRHEAKVEKARSEARTPETAS